MDTFTPYIKKQSGFGVVELLVAVAVIAMIAVAGWLWFSNSQTKTNESEEIVALPMTYNNSTYGFSLQYTEDFEVKEIPAFEGTPNSQDHQYVAVVKKAGYQDPLTSPILISYQYPTGCGTSEGPAPTQLPTKQVTFNGQPLEVAAVCGDSDYMFKVKDSKGTELDVRLTYLTQDLGQEDIAAYNQVIASLTDLTLVK